MRLSSILISSVLPAAYAQLNTLAKAAGLRYFGTATDDPTTDAAYIAALSDRSDFGQLTPADAQKWDSVEPSAGTFSFTQADNIVSLAAENGQILRCHNLIWHKQLPSWVSNGTWTNETLTAALQAHITGEVTHYKGKCYAWDVVNEALNDNGTFRNDIFLSTIGEDYIRIAFGAAEAADPDTKLYYNDYGLKPQERNLLPRSILSRL